MKKILALLCACVLLCVLAACHAADMQTGSSADEQMQTQSAADASAQEESAAASSELSEMQTESSIPKEENMLTIAISVGEKTFTATLYDNPSARALLELLPMTLHMSELNGNEKYFYLEEILPTDAGRPSGIHTGDLMLYGNNCLVLFYESFSTSYSYTPLGHIDDPEELASALGSGSVQVTFQKG